MAGLTSCSFNTLELCCPRTPGYQCKKLSILNTKSILLIY